MSDLFGNQTATGSRSSTGPPGKESAPAPQTGDRPARHIATGDTDRVSDPGDVLSYRLGYGAGYAVGWSHGWAANEREWQAFLGVYRRELEAPRFVELEAIRNDSTPRRCQIECGRCSSCIRWAQARRNWSRFGSPDYPGEVAS